MSEIDWNQAEDATAKALPDLIRRADAERDQQAIQRLLDLVLLMEERCEQNQELIAWRRGFLNRIADALNGKNPRQALGELIAVPSHRPKSVETDARNAELVLAVYEAIAAGMSTTAALADIAERYRNRGLTEDVVKNAWNRRKANSFLPLSENPYLPPAPR